MPFPLNITAAGAAGEHSVRRVSVNAQDDYIYFKSNPTTSTIPTGLTQGTGFIYAPGSGEVTGVDDGDLVFVERQSPTQLQLTTESNGGSTVDLTGSAEGQVTFNTPVVFGNRLNIDSSTATNQAVKYFTSGDPLTGLTSGQTYFLRNVSVSDFAGQQSLYSLSDVSIASGQQQFTTPGTFSWTAPAGVYEVSAVAVGGGGGGAQGTFAASGGGGGGLGWRNRIPVTPGVSYTVVVGAGGTLGGGTGGDSFFINNTVVRGGGGLGGVAGGTTNRTGGTFTGDGGGNGGFGGARVNTDSPGGGGGAGGYTGNGGNGGGASGNPTAGAGGGAGGGGFAGVSDTAGAGGGVGILGQGANGAAGANSTTDAAGGQGGSGGGNAARFGQALGDVYSSASPSTPGNFGGGGAGSDNTGNEVTAGGVGAVRIIWGPNRAFPATGTGNV